jgi:hypothetical protein
MSRSSRATRRRCNLQRVSGDEAVSQTSREHTHYLPPAKTVGVTQQSSPPEPGQQCSKQPLQPPRQPAGTVQQQQQHNHADSRHSLRPATAECYHSGCSGCNTTLLCLLLLLRYSFSLQLLLLRLLRFSFSLQPLLLRLLLGFSFSLQLLAAAAMLMTPLPNEEFNFVCNWIDA